MPIDDHGNQEGLITDQEFDPTPSGLTRATQRAQTAEELLPVIQIRAVAGGGFVVNNLSPGPTNWKEKLLPRPQDLRRFLQSWGNQAYDKARNVRTSGLLV